jgi:hypothetical protein
LRGGKVRRLGPLAVAVVAGFGGLGAAMATPGDAAAVSCAPTWSNMFLGNDRSGTGIRGVYSRIEYYNERVCDQGETFVYSWSLQWVGLQGPPNSPGTDIFQGGYAKCSVVAGSCPWNSGNSYTWVYYGHQMGACGQAAHSPFTKIYNVSSGTHDFQIAKSGSYYKFSIDGVVEYQRPASDLDLCWDSIDSTVWTAEMLNTGDQAGGSVGNHQDFLNNEWQDGGGWHFITRTLGAPCNFNSYPAHWHCNISQASGEDFANWDDRFP